MDCFPCGEITALTPRHPTKGETTPKKTGERGE